MLVLISPNSMLRRAKRKVRGRRFATQCRGSFFATRTLLPLLAYIIGDTVDPKRTESRLHLQVAQVGLSRLHGVPSAPPVEAAAQPCPEQFANTTRAPLHTNPHGETCDKRSELVTTFKVCWRDSMLTFFFSLAWCVAYILRHLVWKL